MSNIQTLKNIMHINNLSKQKVSPALTLFSREMTIDLEIECAKEVKGMQSLLLIIIDYVVQPSLNISISKGNKMCKVIIFISLSTAQLK